MRVPSSAFVHHWIRFLAMFDIYPQKLTGENRLRRFPCAATSYLNNRVVLRGRLKHVWILRFICSVVFSALVLPACNKQQQMSAILARDSRRPIEFYGRVIDQDGNPVAGAKVRGAAEIVERWMDQRWDERFVTSDAGGYFHFSGLHGQRLVVSPNKEGYEYKSENSLFSYSGLTAEKERHRPDPKTPVVFTMWKLAGPEELTHARFRRAEVPVDGTPTSFDLVTAKKVPAGGDLIVKIERHPLHIQRGQRFDWKAILEVPTGGIIQHDDVYPNRAPSEGYASRFTIDMPGTSAEWQSSATRSFYVKARDATLYARMTLRITADYEPPPTGVSLEAWVNTTGSRNLEIDPHSPAVGD